MDQLISVVGITALLGFALVGGTFFAYSSFVMKALARVPPTEGVAAMAAALLFCLGLMRNGGG